MENVLTGMNTKNAARGSEAFVAEPECVRMQVFLQFMGAGARG